MALPAAIECTLRTVLRTWSIKEGGEPIFDRGVLNWDRDDRIEASESVMQPLGLSNTRAIAKWLAEAELPAGVFAVQFARRFSSDPLRVGDKEDYRCEGPDVVVLPLFLLGDRVFDTHDIERAFWPAFEADQHGREYADLCGPFGFSEEDPLGQLKLLRYHLGFSLYRRVLRTNSGHYVPVPDQARHLALPEPAAA